VPDRPPGSEGPAPLAAPALVVAADDRSQRRDDLRIELRPGADLELAQCLLARAGRAVRSVGRHRAVGVAGADDARDERDLLAGEAVRVAPAVPPLVARADEMADAAEETSDLLEHALALDRVGLDDRTLFRGQLARLGDDLGRDSDLADVVQERGQLRVSLPPRVEAQLGGCSDDQLDDLKTQIFRELLTYMLQNPATIEPALDLILISRHLERIGDHATNIAEDVIFMVSGRDVRHHATDMR